MANALRWGGGQISPEISGKILENKLSALQIKQLFNVSREIYKSNRLVDEHFTFCHICIIIYLNRSGPTTALLPIRCIYTPNYSYNSSKWFIVCVYNPRVYSLTYSYVLLIFFYSKNTVKIRFAMRYYE